MTPILILLGVAAAGVWACFLVLRQIRAEVMRRSPTAEANWQQQVQRARSKLVLSAVEQEALRLRMADSKVP